jgi:hypothetical protein
MYFLHINTNFLRRRQHYIKNVNCGKLESRLATGNAVWGGRGIAAGNKNS